MERMRDGKASCERVERQEKRDERSHKLVSGTSRERERESERRLRCDNRPVVGNVERLPEAENSSGSDVLK